jgi:hypothetical protein
MTMTTDEALRFLAEHQPMPDTKIVTDQLLLQLNEVLEHFETHLDERCIPLLLNVFGEGDGHGVYQMVAFVIRCYPKEIVVPHLRWSLKHSTPSALSWNTEIACDFQSVDLIEPLIDIAISDDGTLRQIAMFALSLYPAGTMIPWLHATRDRPMNQQSRQDLDALIVKLSASDERPEGGQPRPGLKE